MQFKMHTENKTEVKIQNYNNPAVHNTCAHMNCAVNIHNYFLLSTPTGFRRWTRKLKVSHNTEGPISNYIFMVPFIHAQLINTIVPKQQHLCFVWLHKAFNKQTEHTP